MMSQENNGLRYHHQLHLEPYDETYISLPGAELELVVEELNELMYPEPSDQFDIGAHSGRVKGDYLSMHFSHSYLRADRKEWVWPLEAVTFSVDHSIYLGRSAIRQCYKVKIDSSIKQSRVEEDKVVVLDNLVTSLYYLEETPGEENRFIGSMVRPNIIGEDHPEDELMTAYDCERLYDEISALRTLAIYVNREKQALDRVQSH